MVQLWVLIGLIASALSVSALGATFSIIGLGKLFSGAFLAVWLMAGALELSKFMIAAYLHQVWKRLNFLFKTYLTIATVTLSIITSMGIFGFLSDAYQESAMNLEAEEIKLTALQEEKTRNENEINRINKSIDEIPAERVSRKIMARDEAAPLLEDLGKDQARIATELKDANLKILEVKQKVGPLIYISKAFGVDIDTIVKYLIMLFVFVFDPLAICLVIAVSDVFDYKKKVKMGLITVSDTSMSSIAGQSPTYHPGEEKLKKAAETLKMRFVQAQDGPTSLKKVSDTDAASVAATETQSETDSKDKQGTA
jgi:hypothetical protein